jgi:hypothetical protein
MPPATTRTLDGRPSAVAAAADRWPTTDAAVTDETACETMKDEILHEQESSRTLE